MSEAIERAPFCASCGAANAGRGAFCAQCGAAIPPRVAGSAPVTGSDLAETTAAPAPAAATSRAAPSRVVVVGGLVIAGAVLAVAFLMLSAGGGIAFSPSVFTCSGETRTIEVKIPSGYTSTSQIDVSIIDTNSNVTVLNDTGYYGDLGTATGDGRTLRTSTSDTNVAECRLGNGRYRLVIADPATGRTIASGEFTVAR